MCKVYAPIIAVIADQYGNSGVDKLPYNEHQFSISSSKHIKKRIENSLHSLFCQPLVASFILSFTDTLLSPNFNLYIRITQYHTQAMLCICNENIYHSNVEHLPEQIQYQRIGHNVMKTYMLATIRTWMSLASANWEILF